MYRGRSLPYELGDLAREKTHIGIEVKKRAGAYGLVVDIDWREDAQIYGGRWLDFVSSGRATLCTESGASIVDFDGTLATTVKAYRTINRYADYAEVAAVILQPYEGKIVINTISPRAFEAICLGTALIMFPGEYSGILVPERHYIPLAKDFSNFGEVARLLRDLPYLDRLTRDARQEIIGSGRYSYDVLSCEFDAILAQEFRARYPAAATAPSRQPVEPHSWYKAQLNTLAEKTAHLQLAYERLQADLASTSERLQAELSREKQAKIALQKALEATLASTSWRLTAPLRAGGNLFRALQSFRQSQ